MEQNTPDPDARASADPITTDVRVSPDYGKDDEYLEPGEYAFAHGYLAGPAKSRAAALKALAADLWTEGNIQPGDEIGASFFTWADDRDDAGPYANGSDTPGGAQVRHDIEHVWTVDGEPLGIRHELELDGGHVIARDVGLKHGRAHGPAHERRILVIQAVHVLLNATAAELEAIENRFIEASPDQPWDATTAQKDRLRATIRARRADS